MKRHSSGLRWHDEYYQDEVQAYIEELRELREFQIKCDLGIINPEYK